MVTDDTTNDGIEAFFPLRLNERLTVFGGEYDVVVKLGEGGGHE